MAEIGQELGIGGPLSPAVLRARLYRYNLLLKKYWWLPVLLLSGSLLIQGVRYFLGEPLYVSSGRMMVSPRIMTGEAAVYTEELSNYFGTQVSLMQSEAIKHRAMTTVESAHPDMKGILADLAVQQEPKASIFILKVTSPDPKYSQLYADACMSEFLEFKKEMRGETSQKTVDAVAKQLAELEKAISELDQKLFQFKQENNVVFLQEQGNYVGTYLVDLNKQLAELKKEGQLLDLMSIDQTLERQMQNSPEALTKKDDMSGASLVEGPQSEYIQTKRQLQRARARLEQLGKYLKPKHPKILALKDEITRGERKLEIVRQQSQESVAEKRQAIQLQVTNLEKLVAESETKALDVGRKMAEYEKMKSERDRQQQLYDRLLGTVQNVNVSQDVSQFDVNILERATPAISIKPGFVRSLLMGLGVGLILSGGLLFLLDRFNDRVATVVELCDHFTEPIYGQVPQETSDADGRLALLTPQDTRHVYAESFRNIRSSLRFVGGEAKRNRVILVTSPTPGDGKSTTTANLALTLSFATDGKVLLIDGDLRRGGLHRLFGLEGEPGLAEVLGGQAEWRKVVQATPYQNLFFVSAGEPAGHPGELFFSASCENLLRELKGEYETVVIDTAPVLAVDDTPSLAPKVDGTLIIYRAGRTSCRLMRNSLEALYSRNAKVLGIIFNGVDPKQPEYGYYKYTEYYYSKTVSRKKPTTEGGEKPPSAAPLAGGETKETAVNQPLPPPPVPPSLGKT